MQKQTLFSGDPNAKGLTTIFVILLLFTPIVETVADTQAIADAKKDAEKYNAAPWAILGVVATSAPGGTCIAAPSLFLSVISNPAGFALCFGLIPAVVVITAHTSSVSPPTERLMGKSPEYVSVYVETYTKRVIRKRKQHVETGCAAGGLVSGMLVIVAFGDEIEEVLGCLGMGLEFLD